MPGIEACRESRHAGNLACFRKFGRAIGGPVLAIGITMAGACSVGLRRSEIDGYFLGRETLGFDSITAGLWLALQCPSR